MIETKEKPATIIYKGMEYEPMLANALHLIHGDEYLFNNNGGRGEDEWTKGKIECYHMGGIGITLIEGRMAGKFWYIFPDRLLCKV